MTSSRSCWRRREAGLLGGQRERPHAPAEVDVAPPAAQQRPAVLGQQSTGSCRATCSAVAGGSSWRGVQRLQLRAPGELGPDDRTGRGADDEVGAGEVEARSRPGRPPGRSPRRCR